MLKKLKPAGATDDLEKLLRCAVITHKDEVTRYLIKIGANPNDKPDGGSTGVEYCIHDLRFGDIGLPRDRLIPESRVYRTLDSLRVLTEQGARWTCNKREIDATIKLLLKCEPDLILRLVAFSSRTTHAREKR